MSKAEERALEAYPEDWWFANPGDWGIVKNPRKKDYNAEKRATFILGYKQAEKDLALTWEDIRKIVVLSEDVFEEGNNLSVQEFYEEILKRFKEAKK